MNLVRFLVVAVLSGLGLVGVTATPASACSCAADGLRDDMSSTDVVFVGTLADSSQDGDDMSGTVTYTFDVDEVYHGRTVTPSEVTTPVQDSACGLTGLAVDRAYVVFAGAGEGSELHTSSCTRTSEATAGLVRRVAAIGGAPSAPTPAPPDGLPVLASVAGAVGVALLGAILLVIRGARAPH
ncbi:MAG: hypothetical protein M3237_15315 [Actinomycetota bacterium]|nr:hypothetical protein [Actinomycetota bacterium]